MKTLQLLSLLVIFSNAHAETENFNMSLNGTFESDYCYLDVVTSINLDIDVSSIYESATEANYTGVGLRVIEVKCSNGVFDIEITKNSASIDSDPGDGFLYRHKAINTLGLSLNSPGIQENPGPISSSIPFALRGVDFGTYGGTARFSVFSQAFPKNGDWNSLPDSFNYTESILITIDKKS